MSKPFKLVIVRACHDSTVQKIPDADCLAMLMTGQHSLLRYWRETSGGYFDFLGSAMMKWVDVTIDPAASDRGSQASVAFAAVRAANPGHDPLAGYDGALVITHPGQITSNGTTTFLDGGSTEIDGLPIAVIPVMSSDHTFMCHELGHTLGLDHTFGVDNNGADWNPNDATIVATPEYGSPYDLMSSASFGSRWLGTGPLYSADPTFDGPAIPGWPYASARSMGPNLSRANLHRWFPDALEARQQVAHRQYPAPGENGGVRLIAAESMHGTTLLILHPTGEPASGAGRIYVEYRPGRGWDRGMKFAGTDLARAGVAVHTLEDMPGATPRVWFRGAIACGAVDSDFHVPSRPVVLTLEDYEDEEGNSWAHIGFRSTADRSVTITKNNASDDIIAGEVLREERTPCGDVVKYGSWITTSFCQFQVRCTGYGGSAAPATPPTVSWAVAGTALTGQSGIVVVPFNGAEFDLEYTIDPMSFELTLSSRGGERYSAQVVATVAEAGGASPMSTMTEFAALGYFEGFPPEDKAVVLACLLDVSDRNRIPVPWRFRRPDPDPRFAVDPDLWRARKVQAVNDLKLDASSREALLRIIRMQ